MGRKHSTVRSSAVAAMAAAGMVLALRAADPANFKPDGAFKGSTLAGWHVVGAADWKAQNGELIGTARPGTNGGWLVMDKSFQDVQLYLNYKCTSRLRADGASASLAGASGEAGECKSGVLLRARTMADGAMAGVYVSLTQGDTAAYSVTIDASGKEISREQLTAPNRGGGAGTAGRAAGAPAPAGGAQTGAAGAAPAPPAAAARGQQVGSAGRGRPTLKAGEWNETYITIGQEGPPAGSTSGPVEVLSTFAPTAIAAVDEKNATTFGAIALYVGGTGEVHYKDLAWKDLISVVEPKEQVSPRFTIQRLTTVYYGWGATTGDVNRDGHVDVISGPFYYAGPGLTDRRRYREGVIYNPENQFGPDMVNLSADFTGDGWPDILSSLGNRHMDLYVNPNGDSRRWDKYSVLPTISSEIVLLKDLDKDGKPEVVFGQGAAGGYAWARPDAANPTAVWTPHVISSPGQAVNGHGLGAGDVNGDGRVDVVVPTGWYEQPAGGLATSPWTFHEAALADNSNFGGGGGEMGVYDINGDGRTDVVSGSGHNWGLNWYEQKKDGVFEPHMIARDFSTRNTGDVVFSESHGQRFADMDGDKVPDMITGKRYWSEAGNNTLTHNDPWGAPVLYVYKTVRDPKAPGGARFAPELVHNKSGIGSSFDVVDLNKDGKLDIVTATTFGTYVFFGKPAIAPAAAKKQPETAARIAFERRSGSGAPRALIETTYDCNFETSGVGKPAVAHGWAGEEPMNGDRIRGLFDLRDRIAVVTGGGGDLCGTMAQALGALGVKVAILDLEIDKAAGIANAIEGAGGEARAFGGSVLDPGIMQKHCHTIRHQWGVPDILINGAGGNDPLGSTAAEFAERDELGHPDLRTFFSLGRDSFDRIVDLNFQGTVLATQVFARGMVEQGSGAILNISSMSAFTPLTKVGAYSAAKAAVANFTRWLAVHFAHTGVRVNALAPGFFMTEQLKYLHVDLRTGEPTPRARAVLSHTPLGRYGDPDELLGTMVWLLSDASKFVTGAVVPVDGGFSAYSI